MTTLQSAFPVNDANLGSAGAYPAEPGMTLRDYFAAKVMAAQFSPDGLPMPDDLELRAAIAYKAADFMLRQRDK